MYGGGRITERRYMLITVSVGLIVNALAIESLLWSGRVWLNINKDWPKIPDRMIDSTKYTKEMRQILPSREVNIRVLLLLIRSSH